MKLPANAEGTATTARNAAIAIPPKSCLSVCCVPNMTPPVSLAIAVCDLLAHQTGGRRRAGKAPGNRRSRLRAAKGGAWVESREKNEFRHPRPRAGRGAGRWRDL